MMNERDLFAALPTIDEAVSQRLHQPLVDVANAAGLLDAAYRTQKTPVGTARVARRRADRRRGAPWAAPAQTTRCPSWCPVTAWCGATAPSDSTSVASKPSTCCSRLSRPHEPWCEEVHAAGVGPTALRAIARGGYVKNRVFFADEQTAIAAGYRPCAACLPDTHARWKARRH